MDELKACPFCGEQVETRAKFTEDSEGYADRHEWVECTGCARDFWPVDAWNTRPLEDAQAAEIAALKARIAEMEQAARWIPVGERLPPSGMPVLIATDIGMVKTAEHYSSVRQWSTDDGEYYHDEKYDWITHWCNLPEPPEVK